MVDSIEQNSVRKGFDPRDFALVAEGGAGPAFAADIARRGRHPAVVVPPTPGSPRRSGCSSPTGLRVRHHDVPAALRADAEELEARFVELEEQALQQLQEDGIPEDRRGLQRVADSRYVGQGYELRVDVGGRRERRRVGRELDAGSTTSTSASTRGASRTPTWRSPTSACAGWGPSPPSSCRRPRGRRVPGGSAAPRGRRVVPRRGRAAEGRDEVLRPRGAEGGQRLEGPAIITQYDSTTVVPPGFTAEVDRFGNIVIRIEEAPGRRSSHHWRRRGP